MADYKGLLVRTFKGDTGSFPRASGSAVWTSPDIIPHGTVGVMNPKEKFLGDNFDKDFDESLQLGMDNYIYVRGENKSDTQLEGNMYLYASNSSMLLCPNTWIPINSSKNVKNIPFSAAPGQKIVCNNDDNAIFYWKPDPISSGHYCLISRVTTQDYPAPIPQLRDISDFAVFLRSEAAMGYAQRNVRFLSSAVPDYTIEENIENSFDVPITDAYVAINCYGLPEGSEIEMTCPQSSTECYLEIPKTKIPKYVVDTPLTYAARIKNMPSRFNAPIRVYFWSNGKQVTSNFKIELDFVATFDSNSNAFSFSEPLKNLSFEMLINDNDIMTQKKFLDYCDQIEPRRTSRVGRNTYKVK